MTEASNYLLIDFEASCCDAGSVPRGEMEIIEFGVVMADAQGRILDEFERFVRPVRHPQLTPFCTALTSITQADVDRAQGFVDVVQTFKEWLYRHDDFVFMSWGDYDRKQLQQDCDFHRITYPIGAPHVNAKAQFAATQNIKKKPGLAEAIGMAGLTFVGTHHRGIDDARNIAQLLPFILGNQRIRQRPSTHRSE